MEEIRTATDLIWVIVKNPDEKWGHTQHVSNDLKVFQWLVGGHIEIIGTDIPGLLMLVNEEGKLLNMKWNIQIPGDIITGPLVLVGMDEEDFTDCPITWEKWKEVLTGWGNNLQ